MRKRDAAWCLASIVVVVLVLLTTACWELEVAWEKPNMYEDGTTIPDHTVLKCQIEWRYVGLPISDTDPNDLVIYTYHNCDDEFFPHRGMDDIPYEARIRAREVYANDPDLILWGEWSDKIFVNPPPSEVPDAL